MGIDDLGWSGFFESGLSPVERALAARVIVQLRGKYVVADGAGERLAEVSGRLRHLAAHPADFPAVGDWVLIRRAGDQCQIDRVLPRRTKFSRNAAGRAVEEQVLAANIDTVFVVAALSAGLNLRSLERYLSLASESGALPVIVLTKADLAADVPAAVETALSLGAPVVAVSSLTREGLSALAGHLPKGSTAALVGPSGTGKSTLINLLCGDELQTVQEVRSKDEKGRHTTTRRELFRLPSGGLVIDTPGLRELQLWESGDGIDRAFSDLLELAARCRFSNCRHRAEPGCAVQVALRTGTVSPERLASFQKLHQEQTRFERRLQARPEPGKKRAAKIANDNRRSFRATGEDR